MSKRKKKKQGQLLSLRYRNILRGDRHPARALSTIRREIAPSSYPLLARAMVDLSLRSKIYPTLFVSTAEGLRPDDRALGRLDTAGEIMWSASVILAYSHRINDYLEHKRSFEQTLLSSSYADALTVLDTLAAKGYYSLCTLELRQALLQDSSGLNAQKDFTKTFLHKRADFIHDPVSYIAFHGSIRNESTTHIFSFREQAADRIRSLTDDSAFRDWLLYHVCDEITHDTDVGGVLRTEQGSPLVDWFETLMRTATFAIAYKSRHATSFFQALRILKGVIQDPRIELLLCHDSANGSDLPEIEFEDLLHRDIVRGFASQNHDLKNISLLQLAYENTDPLSCTAASEKTATGSRAQVQSFILQQLSSLCSTTADIQSFFTLARATANYRYTRISSFCHLPALTLVSTRLTTDSESLRVELTESGVGRLDHLDILPDSVRLQLLTHFQIGHSDSPTLHLDLYARKIAPYAAGFTHLIPKLPGDAIEFAELRRAIASRDWGSVSALALKLMSREHAVMRRYAAKAAAWSFLETSSLGEAVDFLVAQVLRDPFLSYSLPISEAVDRMDKSFRKERAGLLSTPIILDLLRNRSSQLESQRIYACEDFLSAHGLSRPSELRDHAHEFDRTALTYYLRWLCTPSIMQMSDAYNGTSEYENERIAICALLSELDADNAKEYESESRAITQNQVIRTGVTQVEENKIYVDEAALRDWAHVTLRDSYMRYQALRKSGTDASGGRLVDAIRDVLERFAPGTVVLEIPKSEATELLITMLYKLIDEFMTNPQHGLDRYLSMRIRHGSFAGRLRNPLETNRIITQREAESDQYRTNEYWHSRLPQLGYFESETLDSALRTFSRSFDDLLDNYSNQFIQVKSPTKPDGLFRMELSSSIILELFDEIGPETTFDAFLEFALRYIRQLLDQCLSDVRYHLDTHLRVNANATFDHLSQKLAEFGINVVHELDTAVHVAHTEFQRSLEDVKLWFYRNEPEKGPELGFDELVRIGLRCVTNHHSDFSPNLVVSPPDKDPRFQDLIWFSDIFFIVFDNIRLHSGKRRPSVTVTGKVVGRDLHITVRSDVNGDRINEANRARIRQIKEAIHAGSYHRAVRSEGGSGLFKLRDSLHRSATGIEPLNFYFEERYSQFVVEIVTPAQRVIGSAGRGETE